MNLYLVVTIGIFITVLIFIFKKDSFYNIKESKLINKDLYFRPINVDNKEVSGLTELIKLLKNIYTVSPKSGDGANTVTQQEKYDLLFKDILVNSEKRNTTKYPNPNSYSIDLNLNINNIYKAELIEVYIPAATDNAVNIPTFANRLYFTYNGIDCYTTIQAGTYLSPDSIATELTRQIEITLTAAGLVISNTVGITVTYNKNLNRYIFSDNNYSVSNTIIIYPTNGYVINLSLIVQNSIANYMMLNYTGPVISPPYSSGPMVISYANGSLYVNNASLGDYGEYTDTLNNVQPVPLNQDPQYSNCIISGVVLTNDKLYLSLDKLNGNTCNVIGYQNPESSLGNVPNFFCQVPNNTCVSSSSVKTLLNQPTMYSSVQFYNPSINKLNNLLIQWYNETGCLVRILNHCFTLRVYYFQRRYQGTDFSIPIP
jgi:hypothetical protein